MEKINIYQKLDLFREKVGVVKKDAQNPFYKSNYSTLESVIETITPTLKEVGLGFIQIPKPKELTTIIYDSESLEQIEGSIELILEKPDMQKLGSAITYARRYALVTMFGLEQEDDDGNKTIEKPETKEFKKENPQPVRKITFCLSSKYPYPKDNLGITWGEAIADIKGQHQLDNYKRWKLKEHNTIVVMDDEFESVYRDACENSSLECQQEF